MQRDGWILVEDRFDPQQLHRQETLFTVGNGYLGTRGSFEEGYPQAWPATFVNGVYDDVPIAHTELVNCPDWLPLTIRVDGERFRLDRGRVLSYQRRLDLRRGVLTRDVGWHSPSGQRVDLRFERFASLARPHTMGLRVEITPQDSEIEVEVQASLNGHPHNLGTMHWQQPEEGSEDGAVWLRTTTRHTDTELAMAARVEASVWTSGASQRTYTAPGQIEAVGCPGYPTLTANLRVEPEGTVRLDKLVAVYTSRDSAQKDSYGAGVEPDTLDRALETLRGLANYDELRAAHQAAWAERWDVADVIIEGSPRDQLAVRYSLFQTMIAAPRRDDRVSIPPKTLSGFAYRGHIFWDTEIFIVPFFIHTWPEVARCLLGYRYHTLPAARRKAEEMGLEGAMYPWESGATGREVTPKWVPDPRGEELIRIWAGDIEQHITSDVAYAVWHYWRATGDDAWMRDYGAEIMLDTAVFWGSRVEYDAQRGRYLITDVIGPDEYHDHVDNNFYTNRLVQWHLKRALEALSWLRREHPERATALEDRLDLTSERLAHWADVIGCIFLSHDPETGLIEQFEGFFDLEDVDLEAYEPRQRSMHAILGIEGANEAQVLKQPDVLMLLFLLRRQYDRETLEVNWDYYAPRTDHTYGSSLGPVIHTVLACKLDRVDEAYEHFCRAAYTDLKDLRGNTRDGIHAAAAAGTWQAVVFGFGGLEITAHGPVVQPRLPEGWTRLKFGLQHRGQWYDFDLKPLEVNEHGLAESNHQSTCPALRGVIFDLDGVLTDTAELHYLAWKRLAEKEGIPFDRQTNERLRGVSRRESLLIILGDRPASERELEEMMALKNGYYQDSLEGLDRTSFLPGSVALLKQVRAAGLKVAVASASKNARQVISKLEIDELVDAVSDGHSVERQKPAPDLFVHAANQLGLTPEECVVLEDAEAGVRAALAAGAWTVGVGPRERVGEADVVLSDLESVNWRGLRARLCQAARKAKTERF